MVFVWCLLNFFMNFVILICFFFLSFFVGVGFYESVEGLVEEDYLLENGEEDIYDGDFDDDNDINDDMIVDGERNGGFEMVSLCFLLYVF